MNRVVMMAAALCAALCAGAGSPHKYSNPAGTEFPILGWSAIRGMENQIPERYAEMRQCGFNLAFPLIDSLSEVKAALKASAGSGVKIIAGCSEFYDNPEVVIKEIGDNPQLAGYFFKDEPNVSHYPELASKIARVRNVDDNHLLYLNLFPTYAPEQLTGTHEYSDYVGRYVDELGTGFLSYDHYTITADSLGNTTMTSDYYKNLEIISQQAREAGIPFWAFALSTAHYSFPAATREHLRLQMFSNLAYGAQGVQYFTYWQFVGLGESKDVPITNAGEKGTSWWLVRDLNREIQQLAPVFLGAEVMSVAHSGDSIPDGTRRLEQLPLAIKSLKSTGGCGLLVSHLRNGGHQYLMIVNRDLHKNQLVDIEVADEVEFITAGDEPLPAKTVSPKMWLAPGDYLLYRW
ncbi:MAG: hypothetical protein NC343_03595 [Muribaculum sp.]|nr:hypothetical protein [Muribaculaceae bacterium]MCM1080812.1 hypothetical protein [Muribaculum sp.]